MAAYCIRSDVYALGLPPEAFARSPQQPDSVNVGTSTILKRAHGLSLAAPLTFAILSASTLGAPPAALPTPLVAGAQYYALPASSDSYQVSAMPTGSPVALSDAGFGIFGALRSHEPDLDAAILEGGILLEAAALAYRAPLQADFLKGANARLGAILYKASHGVGNPDYLAGFKAIEEVYATYYGPLIARLYKGGQMPEGSTDATPTIAEMGAVAVRLKGRGFLSGEREDLV